MQYAGSIVSESGEPLQGYAGLLAADGKTMLAGPTDTEGNVFELSSTNANELLYFGAPGYVDQIFTQSAFANHGNVIVLKKGFPMWLAFGLVAAIAYAYMRKNKLSGLGKNDLVPIFILAGGVIGFFLLKQIFEKLGIWKSADTKALDSAATDPSSFWNPNYWKQTQTYTYALTTEQAQQLATQIYDSFGVFNDNEEAVIGIFRSMHTKANVSFLAYIFQQKYGQDLFTFLRGGVWPQDRLSDADVNVINRYVQQLPNF